MNRRPFRSFCNVLHWLALVLWISALVSAAVAAMNVFPITDDLALTLDRFAAMPVEEHRRVAAGIIMDGVFFTVDVLQFVAAPLALLTLLVQLAWFETRRTSVANVLRAACLVIAAGLLAFHATTLAPKMNQDLRAFWAAAEAGDLESAQRHRESFGTRHPTAETILSANLLLLVLVVVATAAKTGDASTGRPELQKPLLAS